MSAKESLHSFLINLLGIRANSNSFFLFFVCLWMEPSGLPQKTALIFRLGIFANMTEQKRGPRVVGCQQIVCCVTLWFFSQKFHLNNSYGNEFNLLRKVNETYIKKNSLVPRGSEYYSCVGDLKTVFSALKDKRVSGMQSRYIDDLMNSDDSNIHKYQRRKQNSVFTIRG